MVDNRDAGRDVRVPDDLWYASLESARWRGENVSLVVRRACQAYVTTTNRRRETGELPRQGTARVVSAPVSRGGRTRHIRMPDDLWKDLQEAAEWRGEHASTVIRRALVQYVVATERRKRAGEA